LRHATTASGESALCVSKPASHVATHVHASTASVGAGAVVPPQPIRTLHVRRANQIKRVFFIVALIIR
jgi:hypothetical protein